MEHEPSKSKVEQILTAISIASLIAGFKTYIEAIRDILRYRSRFVTRCLTPRPGDKLGTGITVYLYGVLLSFILFLPLARHQGTSISKVYFLFQCLYFQLLLTALVHVSAKAIRGHGSWRDTATVACYFYGVWLPIEMLLLLPLLFYLPTGNFIYVDAATIQKATPLMKGHLTWISSWRFVDSIAVLAMFFICLRWVAAAHQTKLRWLLLGLLLVFFPVMWLHNRFLVPYVSRGVELFSDFISNLI